MVTWHIIVLNAVALLHLERGRERGRREGRGAARPGTSGLAHMGEEKGRGEGEEEEMGCYCGPSERERERLSPSGFSIFLSLFYFPDYIYMHMFI